MQATIGQWVSDILKDILKGVLGGHLVLRLASCSGLVVVVEHLRIGGRGGKEQGIDGVMPGLELRIKQLLPLWIMIPIHMVLELCPLEWKSRKRNFNLLIKVHSLKNCCLLYITDN